ncbi:MAG TPA: cupin domain-containing protein, partial [Polyangiaceae bacterium]
PVMSHSVSLETSAEALIRELDLRPHPEGGFFRETFRARDLPFTLPDRGPRSASTAIYFLLQSGDFSALHRVRSDEVWHHYLGVPLELHCFEPTRGHDSLLLGTDIGAGERPQHVVRENVYQAARPARPGFTLCGCTVAPGFDFQDFEMPPRSELLALFPSFARLVTELTRAEKP